MQRFSRFATTLIFPLWHPISLPKSTRNPCHAFIDEWLPLHDCLGWPAFHELCILDVIETYRRATATSALLACHPFSLSGDLAVVSATDAATAAAASGTTLFHPACLKVSAPFRDGFMHVAGVSLRELVHGHRAQDSLAAVFRNLEHFWNLMRIAAEVRKLSQYQLPRFTPG